MTRLDALKGKRMLLSLLPGIFKNKYKNSCLNFNCQVYYVCLFISLNSISAAKQINCSHKRNEVCIKCKLIYLENIDFNILSFIEDTVLPSLLLFIFKNLHSNCPVHYVRMFISLNSISIAKQINCSHKRNGMCTKCKFLH